MLENVRSEDTADRQTGHYVSIIIILNYDTIELIATSISKIKGQFSFYFYYFSASRAQFRLYGCTREREHFSSEANENTIFQFGRQRSLSLSPLLSRFSGKLAR